MVSAHLLALSVSLPVLVGGAYASLRSKWAGIVAMAFALALTLLAGLVEYGGTSCVVWFTLLQAPLCFGLSGVSMGLAFAAFIAAVAIIGFAEAWGLEKVDVFRCWVTLVYAVLLGLVYATSLVAFYVFWELLMVVAVLMVRSWDRRIALQFFIYTHLGSLLLLVSISALIALGVTVFGVSLGANMLTLAALGLALTAFAIKFGVFPFHTWLPRTYARLPYPLAAVLAGLVGSGGAYGMYRFLAGFNWPGTALTLLTVAVWVGAISALVGGLRALSAGRIGELAAYSSIGHGSFVFAGLASLTRLAVAGSAYYLIANCVVKSLFFLVAGATVLAAGTDDLRRMGLFARTMPLTAFSAFAASLSIAGMPPFALFPGELFVIIGVGSKLFWAAVLLAIAAFASAAYAVRFWVRVFWHPPTAVPRTLPREASWGLVLPMLALSITSLLMGSLPPIVYSLIGV